MSEQQLSAAATQAVTDFRDALTALTTKGATITETVGQSDAQHAAFASLVIRAEAARTDIEALLAGGGSTPSPSTTFAYFDFSEVQDESRPATWLNKAQGAAVYNNYGPARALGGRGDQYGPYVGGRACYSDSDAPDFSPTAIVSAQKVSIPAGMTLEMSARLGSFGNPIFSLSDDGSSSGPVHIVVYANDIGTPDTRSFTIEIKAFGVSETMTTAEVPVMMMNGEKCNDAILVRNPNTNKFEFRSGGSLLATSANAYPGTLVGYHSAWGNFLQADGTPQSPFRASVGFARGANAALYTGSTYTVSQTLPALS